MASSITSWTDRLGAFAITLPLAELYGKANGRCESAGEIDPTSQLTPAVRRGVLISRLVLQPIEEAFELSASHRVLQFADGLRLNLPHAFARHFEDAADFFECVCVAVAQAVPQFDDLAFAIRQRLEHALNLVLEHFVGGGVHRAFDRVVFDEVAEVRILTLAHGSVEADRLAADLQHTL